MRGGLDRLQKEMDALTYNSRTVLNALIRSTVVNGSSQGFTVTRVTEKITLTRVDIYRLYRFYQEWEIHGFSPNDIESTVSQRSVKGFDTIRVTQDSLPVVDDNGVPTSSATTTALVKHSQVLFLNESNIDQLLISNFWLGLIKDSNNPKLVSNSSPIPINLRTPVFDENLASTRYNQHPTYLFPNAYYLLDAFGYSGDNMDHRMDGKSWNIGGDDFINIESSKISLGGIDNRDTRKTSIRRNGPDGRSNFSTTWGYNTHARGLYTTAGGRTSMVSQDAIASLAIGNLNYSTNNSSATVGGVLNGGVGEYIGIIGGSYNTAIGNGSGILGGRDNIVGADIHSFIFPSSNLADESCVVSLDNCATSIESSGGTVFGRNQIAIKGNVIDSYRVHDTVRLFRFTTQSTTASGLEFYQVDGDIFDTQDVNVTAVEYVDPILNPDNLNIGMTIISLSDDVTGVGIIDGGRVSVKVNTLGHYFGQNSVALGAFSQAKGEDQTVVGHYNYIDITSRFMVGTGNSANRGSGFNVTDTALFLSATPRNANMLYGSDGYYGMEITQSVLRASADTAAWGLHTNQAFIGHHYNTLEMYGLMVNNNNSTSDRNIIIRGSENGILIASNPFTEINANLLTRDIGIVSDTRIKSYSVGPNELWSRNSYISVSAGTDMRFNWGENFILSGNTFGSLPTTDKQYAFRVNASNVTSFTVDGSPNEGNIAKTGFYHLHGDLNPLVSMVPDPRNIGTDRSIMNTVMSTQDSNGNIEGWKLFSTTYSSDALQGLGRIYASKFRVQNGVYASRSAKSIAWWDDVSDWGVWYDLVPLTGSFGISQLHIGNGPIYNAGDNKTEIRNIIKHLSYTIIQNTVHIKILIDFKSVTDAWSAYKSASDKNIRIELNPSIFNRSFAGDGVNPGSTDIHNFSSNFVMTARTFTQRRIVITPRGSVNSSTNLDFRSTFSITDELRPL